MPTNADIAALPDLTDAELLKLLRWAYATGLAGQTRTMGDGRSITFASVDVLWKQIQQLTAVVNDEGEGGNIALVVFGDPQ